jgi:hypothetical protein
MFMAAQTPTHLLQAVARQADRLRNVEFVFITVYGDIQIDKRSLSGVLNKFLVCFCQYTEAVNEGRADYVLSF